MSDYYERLQEVLRKWMSCYAEVYETVKNKQDWKNDFRTVISKDIPEAVTQSAEIAPPYKVEGSYGKGRWTEVPWVAVFDTRITSSAQKGIYIVYLLNKNKKELYLSLALAATEVIQPKSSENENKPFTGMVGKVGAKDVDKFLVKVDEVRNTVPSTFFSSDREINSGSQRYDIGTIYYKKYELNRLPSGREMVSDLKRMMALYQRYYEIKFAGQPSNSTIQEDGGMLDGTKQVINRVSDYIFNSGFTYETSMLANFYLCLKSKPFVILAGTSGTGKTKLVRLFAEAVGAEYKLVPVRPDWSDSSDLFGHTNLQGEYVPGAIIDFVQAAYVNPEKPFILCLDEMNLARVEYYLSDFLSLIETRKRKENRIVTEPIKLEPAAERKYDGICLPDNLYVVGTVNMDETTFPFSKKVLDRANTIEFSEVNLMPAFEKRQSSISEADIVNNDFLKTKYLILETDIEETQRALVKDICAQLQNINEILRYGNAHVGYRVRDEIVFYMLNNEEAQLLSRDEAMDNEIMQKILPRIQGSASVTKEMLEKLFQYCMNDVSALESNSNSVGAEMLKKAPDAKRYPKSAKKIAYMMTRYEEDGFTSYWV